MSCSVSVTNPYLYSVFASSSICLVAVLIKFLGLGLGLEAWLRPRTISPHPHVLLACGFFNVKLVAIRLSSSKSRTVPSSSFRLRGSMNTFAPFDPSNTSSFSFAARVERERVAEPRAAAGLDGNAQAAAGLPCFASCFLITRAALSVISIIVLRFAILDSRAFSAASTAIRATCSRSGASSNFCTTRSARHRCSPRPSPRPRATRPRGLRSRWRRCTQTP